MSNALILAAKQGKLDQIKICLARGDDINFCDSSNGGTALYWAAGYGFLEIVEYLISQKARLDIRSNQNETAFLAAVIYGKLNVVKVLIHNSLIKRSECEEALLTAVKVGNLEIVQYLVSLPIQYQGRTLDGKTPFLLAVEHGFLDIVQFFYHRNPEGCLKDVDKQGNTALHIAVLYSQTNVLNFLVTQYPISVFSQRNNDLFDAYAVAIKENKFAMAKTLLKNGCYVDISLFPERILEKRVRHIYNAALYLFKNLDPSLRPKMINLTTILETGLNGRRFKDGNTALHLAILQGHVSSALVLLDRGASLDIKNHANASAYALAVQHYDLLMQAAAHLFKTNQLIQESQTSQTPASLKPIVPEVKVSFENKRVAELRNIDKHIDKPLDKYLDKNQSKQATPKNLPRDHDDKFEQELQVTLQKLSALDSKLLPNKDNEKLLSYMYFFLGDILADIKPALAAGLLQKVKVFPKDPYFTLAHFILYYLIKKNKITIDIPTNTDPQHFRLYLLIKEMLYSKQITDEDGISIQQYILEYTLEQPENIEKLKGLPELLKRDSLEIKNDFLVYLNILWEKNCRERALLQEIAQLKEQIRNLDTSIHSEGSLSRKSSKPSTPVRMNSPPPEHPQSPTALQYPPLIYSDRTKGFHRPPPLQIQKFANNTLLKADAVVSPQTAPPRRQVNFTSPASSDPTLHKRASSQTEMQGPKKPAPKKSMSHSETPQRGYIQYTYKGGLSSLPEHSTLSASSNACSKDDLPDAAPF